jgi:DNA uptake protein ComE-like DNA-binding protein
MRRSIPLVAMGALLLALGCSDRAQRRAHDTFHDTVGGRGNDVRADAVELNTATKNQITRLPGLSDEDADRIIANRPYGDKSGLLRKKVLGETKYRQIEDRVYVSRQRN